MLLLPMCISKIAPAEKKTAPEGAVFEARCAGGYFSGSYPPPTK